MCSNCPQLMEAAKVLTQCDCEPTQFPFVCPRHGDCIKNEHYFTLCRTDFRYFDLYERGDRRLCADHLPAVAREVVCQHLRAVVRTEACDLCGFEKGQPFEVFGCSLHAECSAMKMHSRVRSCASCEDYVASA